jgi:hypothetical protein
MNIKGCARERSYVSGLDVGSMRLTCCPGICFEGQRKTMKNVRIISVGAVIGVDKITVNTKWRRVCCF